MSSVEKSYETVEKSYWYCPSCGASSEKVLPAASEMVSDGTVTCAVCGKVFQESDVSIGNYDQASKIGHPSRGGNRNPLALVVVAVVAAAMLYFGFHMARRSAPPPPISKTSPAPDFTLESLDGKSVRLSDLRGKAVLLNFWATWCGPCKVETPWLIELRDKYASQGFEVIGISTEGEDLKSGDKAGWAKQKAAIQKFVSEEKMPYPVLIKGDSLSQEYGGLDAMPTSFFVDRKGTVVAAQMGLTSESDIESNIKKALAN